MSTTAAVESLSSQQWLVCLDFLPNKLSWISVEALRHMSIMKLGEEFRNLALFVIKILPAAVQYCSSV